MILKEAQNIDNLSRKLFFTLSARVGWRHLLYFLNIKSPDKILIPAYIGYTDREGSGVMDPINQTNTPFEFYSLDKRLSCNFEEVSQKLALGNIKLILVIHY